MSSTVARRKTKAPAFVVATTTMSGDIDGHAIVIVRGRKYEGTNPAVAAWPDRFIPVGDPLPPDELPGPANPPEAYDAIVQSDPTLNAVRLRRDMRVHVFGGGIVHLRAGTLVARDHELVQRHENWFHIEEEQS